MVHGRLFITFLLFVFLYCVPYTARAQDATACLSSAIEYVKWAKDNTRTFTNTCGSTIELFWCHDSSEKKFRSRKCNDDKYYSGRVTIKPGETKNNYYSFPANANITFGACFGQYGSVVSSGSKGYACKTNVDQLMERCASNIENCDLFRLKDQGFDLNCTNESTINGKISTELHGDTAVVKIASGKKRLTLKSSEQDIHKKIVDGLDSFCAGSSQSKNASLVSLFARQIIIETLLDGYVRQFRDCTISAKDESAKKQCAQDLRKNDNSITVGKRG